MRAFALVLSPLAGSRPTDSVADAEGISLTDALEVAIEDVLRTHAASEDDHGVMISWVLCLDMAPVDGERYMRLLADPSAPVWHRIGMVDYAKTVMSTVFIDDECEG